MQTSPASRIYPCGDQALTLELGSAIDASLNQQVISLFHFLQDQHPAWIQDIIPSYHTLTIVYDLAQVRKIATAETAYEYVKAFLLDASARCEVRSTASRNIQLPVCYDPAFGVDLAELAALHAISIPELVRLHTSKTYRVYLLGFLPGFAYMGSVDGRIATPRRSSPRNNVVAGSVGIAGGQTGIYPFDSPGGWQLIGRTPLRMFDAHRDQPALLQPGDEVQFYPIDISEFNNLLQHGHPHS